MRALISVSDKTGIVEFARGLAALGVEIVSTGGTHRLLAEAGIPARGIEALTGFPEMLDGRVKTLHPKVHGGILARRDLSDHVGACAQHAIGFIDLVVVNLYPFERTIAKNDATLDEAIENIDIGGPTMIRSAAKNMAFVTVVVNHEHYANVLAELSTSGDTSLATRQKLAQEAFLHTGRYDSIISTYLAKQFRPDASLLQPHIVLALDQVDVLRYGENPHQQAALYKTSIGGCFSQLRQHHGKALSFNNLIDAQAAWDIVSELGVPAAVVIKHTNPCGAAIGNSLYEAYQKAYDADPVSAFGSIVGLNRKVDLETAQKVSETFVEVVVAPGYESDAAALLSKKAAIRLLEIPASGAQSRLDYRFLDGLCLVQEKDDKIITRADFQVVTKTAPTSAQSVDLE
ncbi:MAG: bifunctional phosphoribosylaminoimidazolecarboxamide formyltransferase/IMP cyclohydrolase, partial [Candidatus Margulisiibacteriota bacterium]